MFHYQAKPKVRVISDNDYAGDPDGLVQLAHLLLSKTADVKAVISSHLRHDVPWPVPERPSTKGAELAQVLAKHCNYNGPVFAANEAGMTSIDSPSESEAVDFLIREAGRKQRLTSLCDLRSITHDHRIRLPKRIKNRGQDKASDHWWSRI